MNGRDSARLAVCAMLALAAGAAAVAIGSRHVDFPRAFAGGSPDREIVFNLRLPRALLALWTGGALSLSGVVLQAVLRNPLASSYTLGVSGGASLGAVIAIFFGLGSIAGMSGVSAAACMGAAAVLLLVLAVAEGRRNISTAGLLLAGVTIDSICAATILFLSNLTGLLQSYSMTRWLMGGMDAPDYPTLAWLTLVLTPVTLLLFRFGREWNLLAVGDTWAATRGVEVRRLTLLGCVAASVLTGAVTALTGPIAFVGLIVPHALRMWLGADNRLLAPCSFFAGAGFLTLCDICARTVLAPVEIPVGVITALLGGPFFIGMLLDRRRGIAI